MIPSGGRRDNEWLYPDAAIIIANYPKGKFGNWDYNSCFAFVELLEKAQKFDEINNEKNCQDKEKVKVLNELLARIEEIGLQSSVCRKGCLALANRLDRIIEKQ